jgi:Spy/CpxP family protein refolding chaperone
VMKALLAMLAILAVPLSLAAQPPVRQPQRNRMLLERQIMQRFAEQVGDSLELSADGRTQVEQWLVQSNARRRELARETAALRRELAEAVRAPETSDAQFEQLLDRLADVRRRQLEALRSDEQELSSILTPRQRAQLFLGLARLQERMRAIMAERAGPPR